MFIVTNQALLFVGQDGEKFRVPNGYMGNAPEWVEKTRQFSELVKDGKIVVSKSSSDKDLGKAVEKTTRRKSTETSKE